MRLAIDGGHGILVSVGCLKVDYLWGLKSDKSFSFGVDYLWGLKSDKSFSFGVLEKDYAGRMTSVDPQWKILVFRAVAIASRVSPGVD